MKTWILVLYWLLSGPAFVWGQEVRIEGHWEGALVRGGSVQLISLDLQATDEGYAATAELPYRGHLRFPVRAQYAAPHLTMHLGDTPVSLLVDGEAGNMRGGMTAGDGTEVKVYLQRLLEPVRPPLHEEAITFAATDGVRLAGTLIRPPGPGPHPVIVYVTGRSNGARGSHRNDAVRLARRGVAGLIYDSRGTGQSEGNRATLTDEQRFADVLGALEYIAGRDDLDPAQVGLFAVSAGNWVAPVVAQQSGSVTFMVTVVGPAESLADQQGHVVQALMRRSDQTFTEEEYDAAFEYQKRLVQLSADGADWDTFVPLIEEARQQPWADFVDIPEDKHNPELDYFRRRSAFDPVPYLKKTTVSMLALYGEDDFVVPPQANVPKLRQYLTEAGNQDFKIVVVPDAGHGMTAGGAMQGNGGWPQAYYRWRTVPPIVHETIVKWVLDHVDRLDGRSSN